MSKLVGWDAIRWATENGRRLQKYTDPIEEARSDISVADAASVAMFDPSLIWVEVPETLVDALVAGRVDADHALRCALDSLQRASITFVGHGSPENGAAYVAASEQLHQVQRLTGRDFPR